MNRPEVYELPSWRDPPLRAVPVVVSEVLRDFRKYLGDIPATLETERAVSCFAGSCGLPLCDADIDGDIFDAVETHARFVSRKWVRTQYAAFYAWCVEQGWVKALAAGSYPAEAPDLTPDKPVKKRKAAAATS